MKGIRFPIKRTSVAYAISLCLSANTHSAIVRNDLNYQLYRDFAENKGQFSVGAKNIPIFNRAGNHVGTMLNNIPMIDFSAVDRNNAVAVAIAPQYITSVAHNVGYGTVSFGNQGNNPEAHHFNYQIVDRNDYPDGQSLNKDYHVPRLHKLITEIEPIPTTTAGLNATTYLNERDFPLFLRVGSGVQMTRDDKGNNQSVAGAYRYLIGGTPTKVTGKRYSWIDTSGSLYENHYGPMTTYGMPGDSGSSLFAFDNNNKRWVQLGVLNFYSGDKGTSNTFSIARNDFIQSKQQEDMGFVDINNEQNGVYDWYAATSGLSTISPPIGKAIALDIASPSLKTQDTNRVKPSLNHGKNISISGKDASLVLHNSIDQGAGTLQFNANVTVRPTSDQTWQGGGVIVSAGKQVNWQVKNPSGDRLSKLGGGTLNVNGRGVNSGDISVGDGTVVLNQQADAQGRKRAFDTVGIVSGRGTVRLGSADQIDLNKLYFGFRGGRLDLNGNSVSAGHIQNVDSGARIVNHNPNQAARLTLTGKPSFTASDIRWGEWSKAGSELYEYINPHRNRRTDYFVLKGNASGFYPLDQNSNDNWEFISSNKQQAINTILERKNRERIYHSFNGFFGENQRGLTNGRLDITYRADRKEKLFHINGGSALNGEFAVEQGRVLFSGKPTPHAYDHLNHQEVVRANDWQNSRFSATRFITNNASELYVGRNVSEISGTFESRNQSKMHLGFEQGAVPNCRYSDYFGTTDCQEQAVISSSIFANLPTTHIRGNAQVLHNSSLNIGKAILHGSIQADRNTTVRLSPYAKWYNNGQSQIGHLRLESGAEVNLNPAYATNGNAQGRFNRLIVRGNLNGQGRFNYLTDAAAGQGDHVEVQGIAQGNFTLAVKDSGREPSSASPLSLLTLKHADQHKHSVNVQLDKNYVDLGAYRYVLSLRNGDYRLYNPLKAVKTDALPQTAAIQQASDALKREEQRAEALRKQQQETVAIQQRYQQALNEANQRLDAANAELNRLRLAIQSRFNFTLIGQLIKASSEVQKAKRELATVKRQPPNVESQLRNIEAALAKAREAVNNAQQALNTELNNAIRAEAEKQCKNDTNTPHCALGLYQASADMDNLIQANWVSRTANSALSELSAQFNGLLQIEQQLDQHYLATQQADAVWLGHSQQQTEYGSARYRNYRQNGQLSQLGGSAKVHEQWQLGGTLSLLRSSEQYDGNLNGSSRTQQFGIFAKYRSASGLFSVINSNFMRTKQRLDETRFNRDTVSFGATIGQDIDVYGVHIQPSFGIKYYRLGNVRYRLNEADISIPTQHITTYQAGLKLAKTWGESWKVTPSVAAHYLDASRKALSVNVNDIALEQAFGRTTRLETGLKLEKDRWQAEATLGYLRGNELKKQRFARLNIAYSW